MNNVDLVLWRRHVAINNVTRLCCHWTVHGAKRTTCLNSRHQNSRHWPLAVTQQRSIVASYWKDTMWFCHRLFFIWLCCFNPPNTTSNNFYRHEIICTGNTVSCIIACFLHLNKVSYPSLVNTFWRHVISDSEVVYTVYTTPQERGISLCL